MKKQFFFALLSLVIFLSGCNNNEDPAQTTNTFPVIAPIVIDTLHTHDFVADIQSVKYVELRARVQGYIEKIFTDEGKSVREGDVLFAISSQEYEEDLLKAKASLKSVIADAKAAELDLHNVKLLVDKNVISKTEMDIASSKLDALRAKIEEAQSHEATAKLRLSLTKIRAPFSGIIDRIPHKVGSLIDEGTLLTTLSDNQEVFAYFHVSEKEYLDYTSVKVAKRNNEVSLVLANNSLHPHKGQIETIEGEFDKNTGSIAFRARFANPEKILKHGSSGKIRLVQDLHNVLVIPQKSAFEIQDKIFVYVVNKQNIVEVKSFVPKLRIPHLYIVESGLSVNDRIIYEGIQDVKEGMKVVPQANDLKKILPDL